MIIWVVLFFIVVLISFVLAFQSMGDFKEKPHNLSSQYSLFLIKNRAALTAEIVTELHNLAVSKNLILSFERLFKGSNQALVLFAPKFLVESFSEKLGLLEIEDYSKNFDKNGVKEMAAWEMGLKNIDKQNPLNILNFAEYIPKLNPNEQFWWQVLVQPVAKSNSDIFYTSIRAVVLGDDVTRSKELSAELSKIGNDQGLAVLPQVNSPEQIISFYQNREVTPLAVARIGQKGSLLALNSGELHSLLGLSI